MIKNNMIESLQGIQEILEGNDFKALADKQREILNSNYNTYITFEYCEDGGYIFLMSESMFKKFEYYLGMEYEKKDIVIKINLEGNVLVSYDYDSERAEELFELLKENEEE